MSKNEKWKRTRITKNEIIIEPDPSTVVNEHKHTISFIPDMYRRKRIKITIIEEIEDDASSQTQTR